MDTVRNFIHVIGITPEEQLPDRVNGQLVRYSDIETIFIPEDKPPARSIFQVMVQVEVTSSRIINAPLCRTAVIDGIKKYKVIYTDDKASDNANFLILNVPYNTFIELPEGCSGPGRVDVFIMDAYFSLIDSRRIYSYTLYMVHAQYGMDISDAAPEKSIFYTAPSKEPGENILPPGAAEEMLISRQYTGDFPQFGITEDSKTGSLKDILIDMDAEYL